MHRKTSSKHFIINDIKATRHSNVFYIKDKFTFKQHTSVSNSTLIIYDIEMSELKNYYHVLLDIYPAQKYKFYKRLKFFQKRISFIHC